MRKNTAKSLSRLILQTKNVFILCIINACFPLQDLK